MPTMPVVSFAEKALVEKKKEDEEDVEAAAAVVVVIKLLLLLVEATALRPRVAARIARVRSMTEREWLDRQKSEERCLARLSFFCAFRLKKRVIELSFLVASHFFCETISHRRRVRRL